MARIFAIDYGQKRAGVAVTDAEAIIASPLTTTDGKSPKYSSPAMNGKSKNGNWNKL